MLKHTLLTSTVVPEGWAYNSSLAANARYIKYDVAAKAFDQLGVEDDHDIFVEKATGEKYYLRRN